MLSLPCEVLDIVAETPSIWACLRRTCRDLYNRAADIYKVAEDYNYGDSSVINMTKVSTGDITTVNICGYELRVAGEMPALERSSESIGSISVVCAGGARLHINENAMVLAGGPHAWLGDTVDMDILPSIKHIFYDRIYKVTGAYLMFGQFAPPAPFAYSDGQKIILCETPRLVAGVTVLLLALLM